VEITKPRWVTRRASRLAAWLLLAASALPGVPGYAHPLGNNTINRQTRLALSGDRLDVRYLMDIAEIPTLVEGQKADANGDGNISAPEWNAYVESWAKTAANGLNVHLDGQTVNLRLLNQRWHLLPGAADLDTLRLEANYSATWPTHRKHAVLHFADTNKPEQLGWKEIWLDTGAHLALAHSSVALHDRSHALTDYSAFIAAPPNELDATAELTFDAALDVATASPTPDRTINEARPHTTMPLSWRLQSWAFFKLGMHHIATGWDHLVFLLGLLLLVNSLPQLIKTVTAFTIAHSITLALAANHWVTPPGSWVEPGIALTIAYVGLVNLLWRKSRHGAWLAFGFGLVHGFGFAGALAETLAESGAAQDHWLVSLLSFNLGIETFQIGLVLLTVPLMRAASRYRWFYSARQLASFGVFSAGLVWFFSRI
jgi:hypothetical protein